MLYVIPWARRQMREVGTDWNGTKIRTIMDKFSLIDAPRPHAQRLPAEKGSRDRLIIRNFPEFSLGAESAGRLNTPMHQARYETPADHDFADSQRIISLSLLPKNWGCKEDTVSGLRAIAEALKNAAGAAK